MKVLVDSQIWGPVGSSLYIITQIQFHPLENSGAPSSNYIWVLITSHHPGPIHQPAPGAPVTVTASPFTTPLPNPLHSAALHVPRPLGGRGSVLTTYEVPAK